MCTFQLGARCRYTEPLTGGFCFLFFFGLHILPSSLNFQNRMNMDVRGTGAPPAALEAKKHGAARWLVRLGRYGLSKGGRFSMFFPLFPLASCGNLWKKQIFRSSVKFLRTALKLTGDNAEITELILQVHSCWGDAGSSQDQQDRTRRGRRRLEMQTLQYSVLENLPCRDLDPFPHFGLFGTWIYLDHFG